MYSERLLDHFRSPRHAGTLDNATLKIEVSNPACGDELQLFVRIEQHVVVEAAYLVRGCTASIACGSAMAEWLTGRTCDDLALFNAEVAESLVDGLPSASRHAAVLCADAVRAARQAISAGRHKMVERTE